MRWVIIIYDYQIVIFTLKNNFIRWSTNCLWNRKIFDLFFRKHIFSNFFSYRPRLVKTNKIFKFFVKIFECDSPTITFTKYQKYIHPIVWKPHVTQFFFSLQYLKWNVQKEKRGLTLKLQLLETKYKYI